MIRRVTIITLIVLAYMAAAGVLVVAVKRFMGDWTE